MPTWLERVWPPLAVVILLLAVFYGAVGQEDRRGHTSDEPIHLVRGLVYWQTGDAGLSYAHPPLGNAIATLPFAARPPRVDFEAMREAGHDDAAKVARSYFEADFGGARAELSVARHVMAGLTVAFALFVFGWTYRRWGRPTAFVALALFAGHPTLLAHGGLVTTDLPLALASFVCFTRWLVLLERPGWRSLLAFAAAAAVMLVTKYTAIVLLVLMLALAIGWMWRRGGRWPQRKALPLLRDVVVVATVGLLAINAIYRFEETGLTAQEIAEHPEPKAEVRRVSDELLPDPELVPEATPIPLPFPYVYGLAYVRQHAAQGHLSWFFGFRTRGRQVAYFPLLLTIKTPVGILFLLGLGLWLWRKKIHVPAPTTLALGGLGLAFVALASVSSFNLGVRHVLPAVPIMIVLAARAAVVGWEALEHRLARPAIAIAVGSATLAAAVAPDDIAYFNALVGGRAGGHRISIVGEDWGQDTVVLAEYLHDEGITTIDYRSKRLLRPDALRWAGLDVIESKCKDIPEDGAVVAAHRERLVRRPDCFEFLDACTERTVLEHHVWIYDCTDTERLAEHRAAKDKLDREKKEKKKREAKAERKKERSAKRKAEAEDEDEHDDED